jgi:hypothetical protein
MKEFSIRVYTTHPDIDITSHEIHKALLEKFTEYMFDVYDQS